MLYVPGFRKVGRGVFDCAASQVVVYNQFGDPIVVVVEHGNQPLVCVAGDNDFEDVCRAMGVKVQTPEVKTSS